jgi:hypothetical protein
MPGSWPQGADQSPFAVGPHHRFGSTRVSSLSRLSHYHCPGQLAILLVPQLRLIAELKEKSKDTKEIQ